MLIGRHLNGILRDEICYSKVEDKIGGIDQ
jgi:hypothetical protein